MKKIFCILFVFLFPSSVVANEISLLILDKISKYGNNICNEEGYGDYYLTGNPVSFIDISNDGIQDLIIDPSYQICDESYSILAGGTGGNDFIFFINPTIDIVKSWNPDERDDDQEKRIYHLFIRSFEIVKWEEKNALKVQVHGMACDVSGAQGCYSILSASKKGIKLVDGPHPNPQSTNVFADNFTIGQNLFLNACGGNPQDYKTKPLNLENKILEVPNKVISIETSPYDRPIITKAISRIVLPNGENLVATLDNFRSLTIVDGSGKKLHERKVTGVTSIYEYLHNGKVIGWGVGWHKSCKEYYDDTDFTVLRTYIPYLSNNKIQLHESLLQPNISKYFGAYKDSTYPIFSTADDILGQVKPATCYYCGVDFLLIDNNQGVIEIDKITELSQYNIDINNIDPLMAVNWIGKSKISKTDPQNSFEEKMIFYKSFISNNYEAIIKKAHNDYWESSSQMRYNFKLNIIDALKTINTDQKVISFRSNIFFIFNNNIPDETIFKLKIKEGEWHYTTKHEFRQLYYEFTVEQRKKFDNYLVIMPKDHIGKWTSETVLSKYEFESFYNNLPEWVQPLFLDNFFHFDYTELDTFDEMLLHYNKFCKLNELQTIQEIAHTCFPKYESYFYEVW